MIHRTVRPIVTTTHARPHPQPRCLIVAVILLLLGFAPALAAAQSTALRLIFTEVHYHPVEGESYEFIELLNPGTAPVDLSEAVFDGIEFRFPAKTVIQPGELLLLASAADPGAFTRRYPGVLVTGRFGGKLSNSGERITLRSPDGLLIAGVEFSDGGFWPAAADGKGSSLEFQTVASNQDDPLAWRASSASGGSPGLFTPVTPVPVTMLLSEIRSAAVPGDTDPAGDVDWVEIQNRGETARDVSGWGISDDASFPHRFRFPPGTMLPPQGFLRVICDKQTNAPGLHAPFAIEENGETLGLFDPQGGRTDGVAFGSIPPGFTLSKLGDAWGLGRPTPLLPNQAATLGTAASLKLNEWYADSAPGEEDWVELFNADTLNPVALDGLIVSAGAQPGILRGLAFIGPAGFVRFPGDERLRVGHLPFKLPASGTELTLATGAGAFVDAVTYGAQSEGLSQGRIPDGGSTLGSFPAAATPGSSNSSDRDADGLLDGLELRLGLNPLDPADARADADADGASNFDESRAGTDPRDPLDRLDIRAEVLSPSQVQLSFRAEPGRSYSVLATKSLGEGSWTKVRDVVGVQTAGTVTSTVALGTSAQGYFQVVTPMLRIQGEPVVAGIQPGANADAIAHDVPVRIFLRERLDPTSWNTTNVIVRDSGGQTVIGTVRFEEDYHTALFEPSLPWLAGERYTVRVSNTSNSDGLGPLSEPLVWSFTTADSPPLPKVAGLHEQDAGQIAQISILPRPLPGGFTMDDVNQDTDGTDLLVARLPVLVQEGSFGTGLAAPNGTLRQRGQTTRFADQKSYRIDLDKGSPDWRGLRTIHLNKQPYDLTRVRNKLSFDLFTTVEDIVVPRTLFASVTVSNVSFGGFTALESHDKTFLRTHGLDPAGHLYKAQFFEFDRYRDALRSRRDPLYDERRFEQYLEIEGNRDHEKLLRMLDDIENLELPVNDVVRRHFHRGNLLRWLAANILMNNVDTASHNFSLYSPSTNSVWYLLPWDYDGAWELEFEPDQAAVNSLGRWQHGLANWWGGALVRRFVMEPQNLAELNRTISDLATNAFNPARVQGLLDQYKPTVESWVLAEPDIHYLPTSAGAEDVAAEFRGEFRRIAGTIGRQLTNYFATLERPMPVYLAPPEPVEGGLRLAWSESFDLQGDPITYDVAISSGPQFSAEQIEFRRDGVTTTELVIPATLPAGAHYLRVIIRDGKAPAEHWQEAFDAHYDEASNTTFHGIIRFTLGSP